MVAPDGRGLDALDPVAFRPERAEALGRRRRRRRRPPASAIPLSMQPVDGARARSEPRTWRYVSAEMSTPPGGAAACRRAGPVDGLTDHDEVGSRPLVQRADDHFAGVDAHPHRQRSPYSPRARR